MFLLLRADMSRILRRHGGFYGFVVVIVALCLVMGVEWTKGLSLCPLYGPRPASVWALGEHETDDGARLVGHRARLHPDSHKGFIFRRSLGGGLKNGLRHARRFADKGYNLLLIK